MTAAVAAVTAAFATLVAAGKGEPPAVTRIIDDLRQCTLVDDAVCRGLPARLAAYGDPAVSALAKAFSSLPQAAQLLGVVGVTQVESPAATRALVSLAHCPSLVVRSLILTSLGDRPGKDVDKCLCDALTDAEPHVRATAAEAIGKSKTKRDAKSVLPALVKASTDPVDAVSVTALESLGLIGDPSVVPALIAALGSTKLHVKRTALFAVRFLGDRRAIPAVIELVKEDEDELGRDAAATLRKLTGVEFGADYALWRRWWRANGGAATPTRATKGGRRP